MKRSDAFQRGFLRGFASPFLLFAPLPRRESHSNPADLIAAAWGDVAQAMRATMGLLEEEPDYGKDSQKEHAAAN